MAPIDGAGPGGWRALAGELARLGRWRLAGVTALVVVSAVAEGAGLLLLLPLLDRLGVTGGGSAAPWPLSTLEGALGLYVVVVVAAALVMRARLLAAARLRLAFTDGLRDRLHAALLRMEWSGFQRLRQADLVHTVIGEVGRAAMMVEWLVAAGAALVTMPVLLAVGGMLSPEMMAATLAAVVVAALLSRPLDRRSAALGRAMGEAARGLHAELTEDLGGLRVIRAFGAEEARRSRFAEGMRELRARQIDHVAAVATSGAGLRAGGAVAAAGGMAVAVHGFGMAVADSLVFVLAFARLTMAGLRLQEMRRHILFALPALEGALALLERAESAAEPPSAAAAPSLERELRLEGVAVRHAGAAAPALADIDLAIPARGVTAVVGPSGAGKSTLADLLLGLLPPERGWLLADGVAVVGAARGAWRRTVGYVPQDAFLFHDTIRANLRVADPAAADAALWRALEDAAAAELVRGLPHGLESVVGDRGARLSGGERQRITLARALLRRPRLLILDEATSALDAESERRVQAALERLRGTVTIVVIAHRAATVRMADHVVVLEGGRVAASGPWQDVAGRTPWLA
ncbi:ABC transporter ATP-binding protein [Azospirillum sp. RWY-5-1]|uniref:ABC transporter ATP-binding protein n=1 Tax=Azospirillum oleiclasticum TaxID=2735135 RepID=A0ABX2TKG4_9PROT|nr:ABC transporter ATP-binding protein [Azospirillum oleiclasticum]NYZ16458.1 ABC transporter ATP-binding protein [Azospirillum oleiclasticum]NYZ23826.1 ABC transporter ATP-binding protein [Azospirillum oleiclasticum]